MAPGFYDEIIDNKRREAPMKSKSLPSVYFVVSLINHLPTVSITSLYSTVKVATKPLNIN